MQLHCNCSVAQRTNDGHPSRGASGASGASQMHLVPSFDFAPYNPLTIVDGDHCIYHITTFQAALLDVVGLCQMNQMGEGTQSQTIP